MIEISVFSTSSIHSSFTQHAILLNLIAFSCLNDKGIPASNLLEGEEVEVCQLVPGEVEVVPHPIIKVVPHSPPVLCAPLAAGPCVAYLTHILSRLCQALPCSIRTCHIVTNRVIVTSDALLDWPGLASQGAGVCSGVFGVDATQASCLSTLLEAWLQCSPCPLPPVHWGQFCSHQKVSEVVKWKSEDDCPLVLCPHHLLHHLLPRPHQHQLELVEHSSLFVAS